MSRRSNEAEGPRRAFLLKALVGRTPPFSLFDEDYGGARRY